MSASRNTPYPRWNAFCELYGTLWRTSPPICPTCGCGRTWIVRQSGYPPLVNHRCEICGDVFARPLGDPDPEEGPINSLDEVVNGGIGEAREPSWLRRARMKSGPLVQVIALAEDHALIESCSPYATRI
jgi:hypothetical protein